MDREAKETLRWKPWPYLLELAEELQNNRLIIVLKARQLGVSWLVVAYCFWVAHFNENVKVLFFSKGEKEANDLIGGGERAVPGKAKFIWKNMPDSLRCTIGRDTQGSIDFPAVGSILEAMASTPDAGRSTDATIVVSDEWEYHPYAEQNFAAVYPTLGKRGQFIGLSTADPTKIDTFFKKKYYEAKSGKSNFVSKFLSCYLRPGRDDDWYKNLYLDMADWQIQGEYPRTEEEALSVLKIRQFFLDDAVSQMYLDLKDPIQHELSDKYSWVKIYKLPQVGKRYLVATDPSEGKEDPHAIIVTDQYGEQQAESHGKTTADICALIHDALVRFYNNAFNTWETGPGGAGGIVSVKLEELKTPNRCPSLDVTKRPFKLDKKKVGWWTSASLWDVIIWELEEAVRLRQIAPRNKECLDEFRQFIVPEGQKPQKVRGGSDDYIDAWARVFHLKKYLQVGEMKVTSFKYKES